MLAISLCLTSHRIGFYFLLSRRVPGLRRLALRRLSMVQVRHPLFQEPCVTYTKTVPRMTDNPRFTSAKEQRRGGGVREGRRTIERRRHFLDRQPRRSQNWQPAAGWSISRSISRSASQLVGSISPSVARCPSRYLDA